MEGTEAASTTRDYLVEELKVSNASLDIELKIARDEIKMLQDHMFVTFKPFRLKADSLLIVMD